MSSYRYDINHIGTEDQYEYWQMKYDSACKYMDSCKHIKKVLIEISAQHPLVDGLYPGEEFRLRLDMGKNLLLSESQQGNMVDIYVPGSVHMNNGIPDKCSLSAAGIEYLINAGIPDKCLYGDDLNFKYNGDKGVYNSADEAYTSTAFFKEGKYGKLICVCSPAQLMRKTLYYIEFGAVPLNYSVPSANLYHNYIAEAFNGIPGVLLIDHSLQSPDSKIATALRKERKPSKE